MFKINRYTISHEKQWNKFVDLGNNGTIFHLRTFFKYHPEDRFRDHSLLVKKKGRLFSVFPAAEITIDNKVFLISHPGATVGSFVVLKNLSIADAMQLTESLIYYAKKNGFDGIRITLPPNIYQNRLSSYMDYSFFKKGFRYLKREVTSILYLENDFERTLEQFRPSHRRGVNKAKQSGVQVRQSKDFDSFYKILKKNLNIRHGVDPTHTLEELKRLYDLLPDKVYLFAAYLDRTMIAGVVNFLVNDNVILAFYISHNREYSDYRSLNLLFATIFDWAIKSKFKIYDFGIFTVNGEPNMGLGRFKENFGASGIFRDTIELKIT